MERKREKVKIGDRMQALLKKRGMSMSQFSEKIGMSKCWASNVLNNKYDPSLPTLIRIARILDVTMDDLCGVRTAATKNESEQLRTIAQMVIEDTREIYGELQTLNKHARMLEKWARKYRLIEEEEE